MLQPPLFASPAQMADFMRSVEGDVRAAEEAEQAEAERFATERGDREAFEQRWGLGF